MMAANFQQMGDAGGNPMMMQQQAQLNPGNGNASIPILLMQNIRASAAGQNYTGWHATVTDADRLNMTIQILTQMRLLNSSPSELQKQCRQALEYEKNSFDRAPDKETYVKAVQIRQQQLLSARQQNSAQIQAQAHAQQHQAGMAGQGGAMGQSFQQGMQQLQNMQHLQQQMQPSPMQGQQQPQQIPMGMGNNMMGQNIPPNAQFQMNMQQQQQQQAQMQAQQGGQPKAQAPFTPQEQQMIMAMAKQMLANTPDQQKQNMRMKLTSEMDPAQAERFARSSIDPVAQYFQRQAVARYRVQRAQHQAGQQGAQGVPIGLNRPQGAIPMQQQRSGNPNPMVPQPQQGQHGIPGKPDFGFLDPQQQNQNPQDGNQLGMQPSLSQQGNTTPQNMAGLPVQAVTPNQQRMGQNPQLRQQQFNHQAAAQAQARAQEQARKAQMAAVLQGQAGGLGGPMPPNQSPAMNTLNAPVAGTPQQNGAGPGQAIPQPGPGQFGQPIDPRFAGMNQRPAVNGQVPFPNGLSAEQRQRLSTLPPDKINDMLAKWNESRVNQQNGMAGGMPGGGQMMQNPGGPQHQLAQQSMANPMNQFMQNGQPMQRPPSQMPPGITPQQQALLQRQMQQRMQNPGAPQPHPTGDLAAGAIDQIDFFPGVYNLIPKHMMPQGVTKWGALKQWLVTNGAASGLDVQDLLEKITQFQRSHVQAILRNRSVQVQNQQRLAQGLGPLGVQQPGQPGQLGLTPQMQNQLAQIQLMQQQQQPITMQDIEAARAHPSGRLAALNDDQIRQQLMSNRRNQQIAYLQHQQLQQQQQQQLQNQQFNQQQMSQMGQMPQMPAQNMGQNGLQRAIGPPQQQGQPMPQQGMKRPQPNQPGAPPSKQQPQPQPEAKQTPQARAAKPSQPTSSPAQPQTSKKRGNSDDVVEVPNPNAQVDRPQMQPGQQGMQGMPRAPGFSVVTREQLAAMPEEQRKKYLMARQRAAAMQAMGPQFTQADFAEFHRIRQDELKKWKPAPAVNMSPEDRQQAIALLMGQLSRINQVFTIAMKWFAMTKDEQRLRSFFRYHLSINDQFEADGAKGQRPKPQPSMRIQDIQNATTISTSIVQDVANKYPDMMKGRPAGPGQQQQPNAAGTSAQGQQQQPGPAPLNAANLQQQQQALAAQKEQQAKQNLQRASMNKPPPAPTTAHAPNGQLMQGTAQPKSQAAHHASPANQPPFAVNSPQGIPAYNGPAKIDQGQLRLPPTKKRKGDGGAAAQPAKPGTGGQAQGQSQPMTKQGSQQGQKPATNGQTEQQQPQRQMPRGFQCPDRDCEGVIPPFATKDELDAHVKDEHVIIDPMNFLLDSMGEYLGLDKTGNAAAATAMKYDASSQGKPSPQPKPKSGTEMLPPQDGWAASSVNPQELMQVFKPFETGANGAISNIDAYRSITPNDTPESTASGKGSEPNSDITENMALDIAMQFSDDANWHPFGEGDLDAFTITETRMLEREGLPPVGERGEHERVYNEPMLEEERDWDEFVTWGEPEREFNFDVGLFEMEDSNKFYGVDEGGALYETQERR